MPDTWIEYRNAHRDNGIADGASDINACRSSCYSDIQCTSIDWVDHAAGGHQCWRHRGVPLDEITQQHGYGITHYELRRSVVGWWQKYNNTDVYNGTATTQTNLISCKSWCALNGDKCNSIEWNSNAPAGKKCLYHQYNYGNTTVQSVTHYALTRGMDGHCGK